MERMLKHMVVFLALVVLATNADAAANQAKQSRPSPRLNELELADAEECPPGSDVYCSRDMPYCCRQRDQYYCVDAYSQCN